MADLTLAELKTHIEAELADAALTRLLNAALEDIVTCCGDIDAQVDTFAVDQDEYPDGRDKYLVLTRRPASITSVTEQWQNATATTLSSDDYDLQGSTLKRQSDGTNGRTYWGHKVVVTYTLYDNTYMRQQATINLVKLELAYRGLAGEKAGDYSMTAVDYRKERNAILSSLKPGVDFA